MNNKLIERFGQSLVALAFFAFGIEHFLFQGFLTGRAPAWPLNMPGEQIVVMISGALFLATGVAILIRKAWQIPLSAGLLILGWSGLRNLYQLITTLDYGLTLTNLNKALTMGGCALVMAAVLNPRSNETIVGKAIPLQKYFIGFFLFSAGIQHFLFIVFVKTLVPEWIPGQTFWAYFAGVALMAGGLGLITGIKAQLAATLSGWMVFVWVLLLHLPRALGPFNNPNEWTSVAEATAVSGVLLVLSNHLTNSPAVEQK